MEVCHILMTYSKSLWLQNTRTLNPKCRNQCCETGIHRRASDVPINMYVLIVHPTIQFCYIGLCFFILDWRLSPIGPFQVLLHLCHHDASSGFNFVSNLVRGNTVIQLGSFWLKLPYTPFLVMTALSFQSNSFQLLCD